MRHLALGWDAKSRRPLAEAAGGTLRRFDKGEALYDLISAPHNPYLNGELGAIILFPGEIFGLRPFSFSDTGR